jgi:hypothetical protein
MNCTSTEDDDSLIKSMLVLSLATSILKTRVKKEGGGAERHCLQYRILYSKI